MFRELLSKITSFDFDMSAHPLKQAYNVKVVDEGKIVRGGFHLCAGEFASHGGESLDFITYANCKQRRKIAAKINFNWAGRGGVKEIGKASSAFLYLDHSKLLIDYLVESLSHIRDGAPVLHDVLRRHVNYSHISFLRSGHIVPLNVTRESVGWLMLFDAYSGREAGKTVTPLEASIFATLRASRIVPITSDGFIIQ